MRPVFFLLFIVTVLFAGDNQDSIIFSHAYHSKEAEASCTDCHTTVFEKKSALPGMAECGECHDATTSSDKKDCMLCHTHPDKAVNKTVNYLHPEFSHKKHLEREKDCGYCHQAIASTEKTGIRDIPAMKLCLRCHNDKQSPARCTLCHQDLADKKPRSHTTLWRSGRGHGSAARIATAECEQCHQPASCDACHQGMSALKAHDPNYLYTHGIEARKHDKNCKTCHATSDFCASCH
jgi:predicted CXXCH cytochrome family protein